MPVHVATSPEIGRAVSRTLRHPVHVVPDNLLVGPCALDPAAHLSARCDFWDFDGRERARFRRAFQGALRAVRSRSRLVIWTAPLWSDRAALWALCALRVACRPVRPDLDLVLLSAESSHAAAVGAGSLKLGAADVRRGIAHPYTPPLQVVRAMALFWRRITGRRPVIASPPAGAGGTKEDLAELGRYQAGFFPRLSGSRVALSRFDELIFSCIGEGGATPLQVLMARSEAGGVLRRWVDVTGDVFLAMRLRQWAEHDGGALLESEPYRPENVMNAARYRLSGAGSEIVRCGLGEIARGAPLSVWGATAYDPSQPWVVVDHGGCPTMLQQVSQ